MKALKIPYSDNVWVTNDGRVYSAEGKYLIEMTPSVAHNGYLRVQILPRDSKRRWFPVHRLVLDAWISPKPNRQCNHINGIKDDNRLDNLEWVTEKENKEHAANILKRYRGTSNAAAKLDEDSVRFIRSCDLTPMELSIKYNVTRECIYNIRNRRTWRFVD